MATQAIANIVKSSFGPSGLDKMMVDDIGVCEQGQPVSALCLHKADTLYLIGRDRYQRRRHHSQLVRC